MMIVRAVRIDDLDGLLKLARSATRGLTSLQLDREQLLDRIEQSIFAFTRTGTSPRAEPYVLVMVDDEAEIVGTSTVYAKTGGHQPFYAYRRVATDHHSDRLNIGHHRQHLEVFRTHDGPTEIGSLFLRGKYRGGGRGRWLSLARFMLIASRRHRFADEVIAEMRGRADADGSVPFWNAVTGRFIPVDFAVADAMSTVSKDFIEDMMPSHPIYLDLLPESIRESLGQVHTETEPAVAMLVAEGFQSTAMMDIFDAGPVLRCPTDSIDAVRRTATMKVTRTVDSQNHVAKQVVLASDQDGFTSVMTTAEWTDTEITISSQDLHALGLSIGDNCQVMRPTLI